MNNMPTTQREQYEYLGFDVSHMKEDEVDTFATPFMDQWKTEIFATILGCILFVVVYGVTGTVHASGNEFAVPAYVLGIAFQFLAIFYAIAVYPTLFSHKPVGLKNVQASFLNGLLAGPVFAPFWNHNLTKKKAGVSHIVFGCLMALLVASDLINFLRMMGV